ncbi:MAG: Ig-like domain-containing protein [Bacteroidota bacterium]
MKHLIKILSRVALLALLALSLTDCAKPAAPTGGPRDETPPEVVKTIPEVGSLNQETQIVKIYFDEAIKKGTYGKEIFISPLPESRPKIVLSDNAKRLTIKFEEALRPQTTYVITLTELADFNASNKMKEAFTLAFSTGDQLDSLKIEGKINSAVIGKPPEDMTVMLFDADSVINNDLFLKTPAYITKPNESGAFTFEYLRRAEYRVFAVADKDNSNSYSTPSERIAISPDSVLRFENDTISVATTELFAFVADQQAPLLQSYVWLGANTLLIKFNENLKLDELEAYISDTLGEESATLDTYTWFPNPDPELMLYSPRSQLEYSNLSLLKIKDSLDYRSDSLLRVEPRRKRKLTAPLQNKPALDQTKQFWEMVSYRPWQTRDSSLLFLTDTTRVDSLKKRYAVNVEADAFELRVRPLGQIPYGNYELNVEGDYLLPADSASTDTTFRYSVLWPDPTNYGTLSGAVKLDSIDYSGPIIMELYKDKELVATVKDTSFAFSMLSPGTYTTRVILDQDSSGIWTTGRLWPPKMPEPIYIVPEPIEIRENWDFEGHVVLPMPAKKASATEEESEEETEAGE